MNIQNLLDEFYESCYLRGLTENTIRGYKVNIGFFMRFLNENNSGVMDEECILNYQKYLLQKDISRYTVCNYLRPLKVFMKYVDMQTGSEYAKKIVYPKRPKLIKHIYTDTEVRIMMKYLSMREMPSRDCAIFLLMYDCGLRLSEVINLETKNVDFKKRIVKVMGKGNKERLIPFGESLNLYLRNCVPGQRYFFTKQDGAPITEDAIRNLFRKMQKRTGIDVTPHKLRHNFATNYLLNQIEHGSVDLYQLQTLMGHSDSETTKIYLHIAQGILSLSNPYSKFDNMMKAI